MWLENYMTVQSNMDLNMLPLAHCSYRQMGRRSPNRKQTFKSGGSKADLYLALLSCRAWGLPCCTVDVSQAVHHFQALKCTRTTKQTDSQTDATKAHKKRNYEKNAKNLDCLEEKYFVNNWKLWLLEQKSIIPQWSRTQFIYCYDGEWTGVTEKKKESLNDSIQ